MLRLLVRRTRGRAIPNSASASAPRAAPAAEAPIHDDWGRCLCGACRNKRARLRMKLDEHDWLRCDCDDCTRKRAAWFARAQAMVIRDAVHRLNAGMTLADALPRGRQARRIPLSGPEAEAFLAEREALWHSIRPDSLRRGQLIAAAQRWIKAESPNHWLARENVFVLDSLIDGELRKIEYEDRQYPPSRRKDGDTHDVRHLQRALQKYMDETAEELPLEERLLFELLRLADLATLRRIVVGRVSAADRVLRNEVDRALWTLTRDRRNGAVRALMSILDLPTRARIDGAIRRHVLATRRETPALL